MPIIYSLAFGSIWNSFCGQTYPTKELSSLRIKRALNSEKFANIIFWHQLALLINALFTKIFLAPMAIPLWALPCRKSSWSACRSMNTSFMFGAGIIRVPQITYNESGISTKFNFWILAFNFISSKAFRQGRISSYALSRWYRDINAVIAHLRALLLPARPPLVCALIQLTNSHLMNSYAVNTVTSLES